MTRKRTGQIDTKHFGGNRRSFLKASGLAIVGSSTGRLQEMTTQSDDWEDLPLAEQLATVREATAPYKQLAAADDGYVSANIPLYCGLGYHFDNERVWEQPPQPTRPGSLAYGLSADGQLRLGAAEYLFITDKDDEGNPTDPKPDVFNDEDEPLEEPPLAGTREADGWELIEDPATGKFVWTLHAWVHIDNPDGVFHPSNPDLKDMPGCVQPPV